MNIRKGIAKLAIAGAALGIVPGFLQPPAASACGYVPGIGNPCGGTNFSPVTNIDAYTRDLLLRYIASGRSFGYYPSVYNNPYYFRACQRYGGYGC